MDASLRWHDKLRGRIIVRNLAIAFAVLTIFVVVGALFIPINIAAVTIASSVWIFVVASVVVFCLSIFLLFVLSGIGLLIFSILPILWGIVAILLFPFLLPIIIPLLLIFGFIYLVRKKQEKEIVKP